MGLALDPRRLLLVRRRLGSARLDETIGSIFPSLLFRKLLLLAGKGVSKSLTLARFYLGLGLLLALLFLLLSGGFRGGNFSSMHSTAGSILPDVSAGEATLVLRLGSQRNLGLLRGLFVVLEEGFVFFNILERSGAHLKRVLLVDTGRSASRATLGLNTFAALRHNGRLVSVGRWVLGDLILGKDGRSVLIVFFSHRY